MRYLLLALLPFLFLSCVMPQDLEALAQEQRLAQEGLREAQDTFQQRVQEILADQALTQEERQVELERARGVRDNSVADALDQFGEASEAIAKAVEDRTKSVIHAPVPVTGNPLLDLLLSLGATVGASVYGTNRVRDSRRVARGEPTGKPTT